MIDVAAAAVAFVCMEPLTALVHRAIMHGRGWVLHRSHHRSWRAVRRSVGGDGTPPRWEANDLYPIMFAGVVMVAMAAGYHVEGWGVLVPVSVGVTAYGVAYAFVHDGVIHGRLGAIGRRRRAGGILDRLTDAHDLHHRFNGAPYGMLVPVVPARVRARAAAGDGGQPASGSPPFHEPAEA